MKKIAIVLLMALALVSIVAAEATVSGEFEYGMMVNSAAIGNEFDKVEFDFNATIDDYNTFSAELEAAGSTPTLDLAVASAGYVDFTWAEVTTDWGKLLGLPVGLTTTTGYDGFGYLDDAFTGWGYEDVAAYYLPNGASTKVAVTVNDMFSFDVDWNYMFDGSSIPVLVGATVAVDPVTVKVAYDMYAENFGAEVMFSTAVGDGMNLDVQAALDYDMTDGAANEYVYGFGAYFSAAGAMIGVSLNGDDVDALGDLGVDLNYGLSDALSADVAAGFDMRDGADTFQGLSVSATYAAGAVDYTLGYAYAAVDGGTFNYNAEKAIADGGLFMNVQLDF